MKDAKGPAISQISSADAEYAGKRKKIRREVFLEEMEQVVPWARGNRSGSACLNRTLALCEAGAPLSQALDAQIQR